MVKWKRKGERKTFRQTVSGGTTNSDKKGIRRIIDYDIDT